jgi:DNA topoisomerase-1
MRTFRADIQATFNQLDAPLTPRPTEQPPNAQGEPTSHPSFQQETQRFLPMATTKKATTTRATKSKGSAASSAKTGTTAKSSAKTPAKKSSKAAKASTEALLLDGNGKDGGGKSLIIVESPAKAKTIRKILGKNFQIKASVGHIRDLPEKKLGVDIDNNYAPLYEVMPDKQDIVADLQETAADCENIYLAPDPDREGEAIAWHISELLKGSGGSKNVYRIEFHEITANAIKEALKHPRDIDIRRVDAQQARRVLDRLVGYKLSPLLWKKVTKGLSAGRVQSVAVRLVCEREEEIEAFNPVEYWTVDTELSVPGHKGATIQADLVKIGGKKAELHDEATTSAVVSRIKAANPLEVAALTERQSTRNPAPPFITSTLQREASNRFGYPVKRTMQIAQKLYEGMDLGSEGPVGLITYMRTDSTRIADEAQAEAKEFILSQYGKEFYPETPRVYTKKGKNVQDAHEAIRPTSVLRTPESVRAHVTDEQYRIYKMVWERFVASQMQSAKVLTKAVEIAADDCLLRASHSTVTFPGYLSVYKSFEEDEDPEHKGTGGPLPELTKGSKLNLEKINPKQHFTEPPPRYSEASLVKALEELGIGRPSTYAPTIATIIDRGYVHKEERSMSPTPLGRTVNKLLVEHFQDIVDVHFTAHLENELDEIAENHKEWTGVVDNFYQPFSATLKKATQEMEKVQVIIDNEVCDDCGKPMSLKTSRWGSQFLGCTGYPECKSTRPLTKDQKAAPPDRPSDETCEACQGPMVIRYGRFGDYLACTTETCKAKRPLVIKTGVTCPDCGNGDILQRKSHRGKIFFGCSAYPACKFALWNKPTGAKCPDCSALLVEKVLKKGTFHQCSSKDCKYTVSVESAAQG